MDKEQIIDYLVTKYGELVVAKNNEFDEAQDAENEKSYDYHYQFYRSYRSKCVLMQQIAYDMFGIDLVKLWLERK